MVENADKELREAVDKAPHEGGVGHRYHGHKDNGLFYPFVFPGAVVKAHYRLGTVGQTAYGQGNDFADGIYDRHDPYIQISSKESQVGC